MPPAPPSLRRTAADSPHGWWPGSRDVAIGLVRLLAPTPGGWVGGGRGDRVARHARHPAALRHRELTGQGQHVEVSLLSSILSALTNQDSTQVTTIQVPAPMGKRHPSIAPYEVLATAQRPLAVAAANDKTVRPAC